MGKFIYDSMVKVDFEDRLLAHLQLVIGAKLRRGESFHFTWKDDTSIGDGRTVVWIHPRVSLVYKFYGSRQPDHQPGMGRGAHLHGELPDGPVRRARTCRGFHGEHRRPADPGRAA